MGNIITKSPQPSFKQGFARNRDESAYPHLWDRLVAAVCPTLGHTGVNRLADVSGKGNHGTLVSITSANMLNDKEGRHIDFNPSGSADYVDFNKQLISDKYAASVFVRCSSNGIQSADGDAVYMERASSGNDIWKLDSNASGQSGNGIGMVHRDDGATLTFINASGVTFNDGALHNIGISKRGTAVDLWFDGAVATSGTLNGTDTLTDSGLEAWLFQDKAVPSVAYLQGNLRVCLIYDRCLSDDEWQLLNLDPIAPFRLKRRKFVHAAEVIVSTGDGAFTLPLLWMNNPNIIQLPILEVSSTGTPADTIGSITLPILSVQGGSGATGSFSLPIITVAATTPASPVGVAGIADLTLPQLNIGTSNWFNQTLPIFTVQGEQKNRADGDVTLPMFTTNTVAQQGHVENIFITLPQFSLSAFTGHPVTITLPQFNMVIEGENGFLGTFDRSLPRMTINVKAEQQEFGTSNITLPQFSLDNNVLQGIISLSGGNRTLPTILLNAHAFRGENGNADLTLPILELTTFSPANPSGTFSQTLKMLTLDAFADHYTNRII
jgi:hypothetical protein